MVDKKYFSISLISVFTILFFSGFVSAGWWEDFQSNRVSQIHLSPGCTNPSGVTGNWACVGGDVKRCATSGMWEKVNDCENYVTTSWGFTNPCLTSAASTSEAYARSHCSECGGQGEKCCNGNSPYTNSQFTNYCRGSLTCQSGYCAAAPMCNEECPSSGYAECTAGNTGRKTCSNYDSDTCLEWSPTYPCGPGQTCYGGECATPSSPPAAQCSNECTSVGLTECVGNGRKTCISNYDSDSCLEWGAITPCASGQICISGDCHTPSSSGCSNECTSGAIQCIDNYYYKKCGNYDSDSCTDWSTSSFVCGSNKACSNNQCITKTCLNDCSISGKAECVGSSARKTCGNFDSDSCLEWSGTIGCGSGEFCYGGECATPSSPPAAQCKSECASVGLTECVGSSARRTCSNYDADTCLEWSSTTPCASGQTCLGDGDCHTLSNANACASAGTIQNGKYCSAGLTWETQRGQGAACSNNYECATNACLSGRCVSQGLFSWIRNWFR